VSEESVEVVRRWFRALESGDPAPAMCDPEIEIRNWAESPIPGPYLGYEGLQRWWDDVADAFEDVRFQLEEIEPIDEQRCLTVQRLVGRFRSTGIDVDGSWSAIVTVRDGRILSALGYASPNRGRRAAGLPPKRH
jgi:ketosteroid isomerase-like protein